MVSDGSYNGLSDSMERRKRSKIRHYADVVQLGSLLSLFGYGEKMGVF